MRSIVFALTALFVSSVFAQDVPANRMPDKSKTRGHATDHTAKAACAIKTKDERNVPESEKKAVYSSYRIEKCKAHCSGKAGCEVDHLISLELGGANTTANLWPQPYDGVWNAIDKDRL